MSNRCPQCEKFVSFDVEYNEPEWSNELEIDVNGDITGELRVILSCADCGEEMKDYILCVELALDDIEGLVEYKTEAIEKARTEAKNALLAELGVASEEDVIDQDRLEEVMDEAEEAFEFEVECTSISVYDELQTKDKHGKPIKNMRFMKKFYVVELEIEVKHDEWSVTHNIVEKIQASHFDEV